MVINLKKTTKYSLFLAAFCILCCAVLVSGGYFYLKSGFKKTDNAVSKVPYEFTKPENSGVMLDFCGDKTFVYLDFEEGKLSVIIPPSGGFESNIYGYDIDYTVLAPEKAIFISKITAISILVCFVTSFRQGSHVPLHHRLRRCYLRSCFKSSSGVVMGAMPKFSTR